MKRRVLLICIGLILLVASISVGVFGPLIPKANEPSLSAQVGCPTPPYPSEIQPPPVPDYPAQKEVRIETQSTNPELDTEHLPGTIATVTRVQSFTTTDGAAAVRAFYENALQRNGWLQEHNYTGDELRYFWIADTKPWEEPPCNATPQAGLSQYLLQIATKASDSGATEVELQYGIDLGR